MIFSVLFSSLVLESKAATSKVVEDKNGDGQITADEVDLEQLSTYGLTTGYNVISSDLPGKISNSNSYVSALGEIEGFENTIIIANVDDGKLSFSEWFKNLCSNIYADLTGANIVGYSIIPAVSQADILNKISNHVSDCQTGEYNNFYSNYSDYIGDLCIEKNSKFRFYDLDSSSYYPFCFYKYSSTYLGSFHFGDDGSLIADGTDVLRQMYSVYAKNSSSGTLDSSNNFNIELSMIVGIVGEPMLLFNDSFSVINYLSLSSDIYFSSKSDKQLSSDDSIYTLNANDWNALSSLIYNSVSGVVYQSDFQTLSQMQSIIDSELDDLSDYITKVDSEDITDPSDPEDSEDSGNSDLSNKLEENNQLQQESNQLQEENNQLQEENNALQEEQNETSKGILGKITEFFGGFFENLKNAVVGIFVPDQETMQGNFERLDQFFSDTFGFLYYPFDFLIEAVNIFLSADSGTSLTFPGFSIMGHEVWSDQSFDLTSIDVVNTIFETVRLVTGGVLAFAFINYLRSFFDKRFGGGGA